MADGLELQAIQVFASMNAFANKAMSYHWNVEGPDFYEFHKFFEHMSEKMYKCLDPMAEFIRGMNVYVPYSFDELRTYSKLTDLRVPLSPRDMVNSLLNDCRLLLELVHTACKSAEVANHKGLYTFLSNKAAKLKKYEYWLVSASKP